jgi:AraC-like DNA-binding protein
MALSKQSAALRLLEDVAWLADVCEVRHPLSQARPLWVSHRRIAAGGHLPQPATPRPEWHPYCEFSCIFEGRLVQYVGGEKIEKSAGDMMLLGTGTPHYAMFLSYPLRYVTVFFLPKLLFELGPEGDGARVLARFTAPKTIAERVMHPPPKLNHTISSRFEQMAVEFDAWGPGSELRLRALFIENLVDLMRWEAAEGRSVNLKTSEVQWLQVEKAVRYIHEHYSEPLYIAEIATATGTSVQHLQEMFQNAFGMSCIQYVRSYRISHATTLLAVPGARVTEVALAVGFETLSHFNTSFRSFLGMAPREYMSACRQNRN